MRQNVSGRWSFTAGLPTWCTGRVSLTTTASRSAALTSERLSEETTERRAASEPWLFSSIVPEWRLTSFCGSFGSQHTQAEALLSFIYIIYNIYCFVFFICVCVSVELKGCGVKLVIGGVKMRHYLECVCVTMCASQKPPSLTQIT